MKTFICESAGYCHGVRHAVEQADLCIERGLSEGRAFYSIGTLIHNPSVVSEYGKRGLATINGPEDAVPGLALVRAHGIPDSLRNGFELAGFELVDGTCPNIKATRRAMLLASESGRTVVLVGVKGHAETSCLAGTLDKEGKTVVSCLLSNADDARKLCLNEASRLAVAVQTTFPADIFDDICCILKSKHANVEFLNRLCPVCSDRVKLSIKALEKADCAVVVGSAMSENTMNLANALRATGKRVFVVERAGAIDRAMLDELSLFESAVICSGTSAPMSHIEEVAKVLSCEYNFKTRR